MIQPLHELANTTLRIKGGRLAAFPLIRKLDGDSAVEKCQFPQPCGQDLGIESQIFGKNLRIRPEPDLCAASVAGPHIGERAIRNAAGIRLTVPASAPVHQKLQFFGQEVDDRHAHAMQPARNFVGALVEFAAGVQGGHDQLSSRATGLRVFVHRNPAAVIADLRGPVGEQAHFDSVAMAGERLVHGVVHDLVDQMMQPGSIVGVADIHARKLAHRLPVFQDFDLVSAIGG